MSDLSFIRVPPLLFLAPVSLLHLFLNRKWVGAVGEGFAPVDDFFGHACGESCLLVGYVGCFVAIFYDVVHLRVRTVAVDQQFHVAFANGELRPAIFVIAAGLGRSVAAELKQEGLCASH